MKDIELEKEVINYWKKELNNFEYTKELDLKTNNYFGKFEEKINMISGILNLLEKYQKEIEELKYKYKKYGKVLFTEDAIKENYVSKNEIREKIKTFKNLPNLGIFQSKEPIIRVLMELLGDE